MKGLLDEGVKMAFTLPLTLFLTASLAHQNQPSDIFPTKTAHSNTRNEQDGGPGEYADRPEIEFSFSDSFNSNHKLIPSGHLQFDSVRLRHGRQLSPFSLSLPNSPISTHNNLPNFDQPPADENPTRHSHHQSRTAVSRTREDPSGLEQGAADLEPLAKTNDSIERQNGSSNVDVGRERADLKNRDERELSDISSVFNYAELMKSNVGAGGKLCRQKTYLPQFLFRVHSCAACYHYQRNVPGMFGAPSRKWRTRVKFWRSRDGNSHEIMVLANLSPNATLTIFANSSDASSPLLASFANEHARKNWLDCCEAAEKCCDKMEMRFHYNLSEPVRTSCPATWDSWQCWNETEAGQTAYAPCPHYIYSVLSETSSCSLTAEKSCETDGNWYSKPGPGHSEWTNYSNCASSVIEVQKRRTYVHVTAYGVSIIAIIPALVIFFSYKQLRVDRIILHENLFASMLVNGIFVIAFKTIIILNELSSDSSSATSIITENGIGCRLLFILTKYSRMTNYMWMFCEGYYLHKLIASAFAEQKSLLIFYIMGWVFPIIPTVIYASLRLVYSNERCWVVPEEAFEWIFNGPSLTSLLINMMFLINIIRVLVTKLRAAHANEPSQYRKAVRATLVLLPLFGLHFVVTIYRPPASGSSGTCQWLEIYFYTNDILDGVQGFLVALIFCYLNGEVIVLLRRTYGRWAEQHAELRCAGRHNSSTRLQSRSSRGGSMLGRSVVSTQCYSSVPASPEVCCNINRLSFSSANVQNEKDKRQISPSDKISLGSTPNVNGTRLSPASRNKLSPPELTKVKGQGSLRRSKLSSDAHALLSSSPPLTITDTSQSGTFEMKPRRTSFGSSHSPATPGGTASGSDDATKNGIKSEHEL